MAEAVGVFDQYATVHPLFRGVPTWLSGQDARRLASYSTYEQIYWNYPEAFKLVQRGEDTQPIYIPTGKQIVETIHRFLASDLTIVSDKEAGTDSERAVADGWLTNLLRRERFKSRWSANKRFGIIRGDWLWHLYADPDKPEGSRLSLLPLDPGAFFPLYDDENIDNIIGCYIVEQYTDDEGKERIRRLSYHKETETGGPSPIIMNDIIFEIEGWGQPGTDMEEKVVSVVANNVRLPDPIDSLPVYHIKNFVEPNNPFGSSELRGMERLIAAINQSISDEDLTLVMDGLGVYSTTSGPPTDDEGNDLPWRLGPAKVVEIDPEAEFQRIQGVNTVTPMQDHLSYLHEQLDAGSSTPKVAKGDVDVRVAESGVALAIRMGPLLSRSQEAELEITDISVNLLFDLRKWAIAYEGSDVRSAIEAARWLPVYGEKLPVNRAKRFEEIMKMVDGKVVSRKWAREQLAKIGYELPEDDDEMMNQILEETSAFQQVTEDMTGFRVDSELGGDTEDEDEDEDEQED